MILHAINIRGVAATKQIEILASPRKPSAWRHCDEAFVDATHSKILVEVSCLNSTLYLPVRGKGAHEEAREREIVETTNLRNQNKWRKFGRYELILLNLSLTTLP